MDLGRQLWGSLAGMISVEHVTHPTRRQLWGWPTWWLGHCCSRLAGFAPHQVPRPADSTEEPKPTAFLLESQKANNCFCVPMEAFEELYSCSCSRNSEKRFPPLTNLFLVPGDSGVIRPIGWCYPMALSTLNTSYPSYGGSISQSDITHLKRASL